MRSSLEEPSDDLITARPPPLCFTSSSFSSVFLLLVSLLFLLLLLLCLLFLFVSAPPSLSLCDTVCVLSLAFPLELLCVCGCSTTLETLTCFPGAEEQSDSSAPPGGGVS